MGRESSRVDRWLLLIAALAAVIALIHARAFYHDDAYISLRYVQRFLDGKGLNWTAEQPVEGFTHPLWVFQLIILGALRIDLEIASRLLSIGYLVAIFALWWRSEASMWPLIAFALLPSTAIWTLGGLETIGYVFWLLLTGFFIFRLCAPQGLGRESLASSPINSRRTAIFAGLSMAAALLHRPDGILMAGLASLAILVYQRDVFRPFLIAVGTPMCAYMLFRIGYYGDYQPNSARAKLSGLPLVIQLQTFWTYSVTHLALWSPIVSVSALCLLTVARRGVLAWIAVALVAAVIPVAMGGGDHMAGARMFLPALAFLLFASAYSWPRDAPVPNTIIATFVLCSLVFASSLREDPVSRDAAAAIGTPVGQFLHQRLPPGSLVAMATAGSTAYFAPRLEYIDTLGLNDATIARRKVSAEMTRSTQMPAHHKGDGRYVLSRFPDVMILGGANGIVLPITTFLTERELLASPEFASEYVPYLFSIPAPELAQVFFNPIDDFDPVANKIRFVAYLRRSSDRAMELASAGEVAPPRGPPTELRTKATCSRGEALVTFMWNAPFHSEQFLVLQMDHAADRVFPVAARSQVAIPLSANRAYRWYLTAEDRGWTVSETESFTTPRCPPE